MPDIVLGAGGTTVNKTHRNPCPPRADILVREAVENKETNTTTSVRDEEKYYWGK